MIKKTFIFGKYSYEYFLVYQERKTLALTIFPNQKIVLKCPKKCEKEKITNFLKRKWKWIEKQKNYFSKFNNKTEKKEYISGESVNYLGRQYKLLIIASEKQEVKIEKNKLFLYTNKSPKNEKLNKRIFNKWLEKRSDKIFNERLKKMLKNFDYKTSPSLTIRKMSKRWGSCFSNKKIILNPLLIHTPKECIDYVIVHELCHIKHKKHNKDFYKMQESIIPNWLKIKEKLESKS